MIRTKQTSLIVVRILLNTLDDLIPRVTMNVF